MAKTREGRVASATIVDVAKAAGVSKTTVSDALRGGGRVSEETRQAVIAAAEKLGYSLNRSARSLRTATTGAIGLYIPQVLVRSEHYLSFVYGAVNAAAQRDYDVTLIVAGNRERAAHVPHVDGLVLIDPVESDQNLDRLMATGLMTVSSEHFPGGRKPTGVVWSDHAAQARELLDHLADEGARAPALIASTTVSEWSLNIREAYNGWCAERGVTPVIVESPFGAAPEDLQRTAAELLRAHPETDALVAAGDGVAVTVAPAITAAGRRIGVDFLLASCVDSQANEALQPPITSVDARGGDAGAACVRLLIDLLEGVVEPGTSIELPLLRHTRASTQRAADAGPEAGAASTRRPTA